ncbi:hypothetical protein HCN51_55015 [Nonomuraea sp. FMUSA5-5]|uniref:Uncharacterized protein n=1 Tax=Nonomuraea composti TaxID=2720023 RepID=A0ABX1BQA7_9ACTN|nr:hypothetical protein [Nonomuraea sp. FMUSA5-5]NJP98442.1 hypothetical protein [Nonomuraea sp. FMUSA5-5]
MVVVKYRTGPGPLRALDIASRLGLASWSLDLARQATASAMSGWRDERVGRVTAGVCMAQG